MDWAGKTDSDLSPPGIIFLPPASSSSNCFIQPRYTLAAIWIFLLMMTSLGLQTFILLTLSALAVVRSAFELAIIHTNDIHARFEQFNKFGSTCSEKNAAEGACFGGVARRMTKIREIRANNKNTILLDAGDQFQGTQWFYHYRGYAASHFMQLLGYDVMVRGNNIPSFIYISLNVREFSKDSGVGGT